MVNRRRCVRWVDIKSSVVGFKICAITAGIKKYKSITKKKKNKHDEILLLTKTNPAFAWYSYRRQEFCCWVKDLFNNRGN